MSPIRPLAEEDLPAVSLLYGELARRDPDRPAPGFADFFRRVLLTGPLADPEIPSLVYDDPDDGVVGFMASHVRPFVFEGRAVRLACSGPLIVNPEHRPRGLGALLLRQYLAGPQEMTFNDRMTNEVQAMWSRLGGLTDVPGSISWRRILAPVGWAALTTTRRTIRRQAAPGGRFLARAYGVSRGRYAPDPPAEGEAVTLEPARLAELYGTLDRVYKLRPAYDETFIAALFAAMERVDLGGPLVRRMVQTEQGQPLGAYAMHVAPNGAAQVLFIAARPGKTGTVIDHLFADAIAAGAVEVRGRVESGTFAELRTRGCRRLGPDAWAMVQSKDRELQAVALEGRALLTRFDGEWWMRPKPELS